MQKVKSLINHVQWINYLFFTGGNSGFTTLTDEFGISSDSLGAMNYAFSLTSVSGSGFPTLTGEVGSHTAHSTRGWRAVQVHLRVKMMGIYVSYWFSYLGRGTCLYGGLSDALRLENHLCSCQALQWNLIHVSNIRCATATRLSIQRM